MSLPPYFPPSAWLPRASKVFTPQPSSFVYHGDYITLGQLLKVLNLVQSGGEVKAMLASGAVMVNGEVETRRGRKLSEGDVVRLGTSLWRLVASM